MKKRKYKYIHLVTILMSMILIVSSVYATSSQYNIILPSFSQDTTLTVGSKSTSNWGATNYISSMGGDWHEMFTWIDKEVNNNFQAVKDRVMCLEGLICYIYYNSMPIIGSKLRSRGHTPDFFAPNIQAKGTIDFK